MLKALATVLMAVVVLYGFAMLFMVVMLDIPILMHPNPERDSNLRITLADVLRQTAFFVGCALLGRWLWLYVNRDEA